jgi:hypothetical protein
VLSYGQTLRFCANKSRNSDGKLFMPRLVINPGTSSVWEVQLRPGINSLGRGFSNDFKLDHGSVSTSHCQILVEGNQATIKDLGSTNGTFVNRAPVTEATLQTGQTVHLGAVQLLFEADAPAGASVPETTILPRPAVPPPLPPAISLATIGSGVSVPIGATASFQAAPPAVAASTTPVAPALVPSRPAGLSLSASTHRTGTPVAASIPMPPPPMAMPSIESPGASGQCKFHPKTAGRYLCPPCGHFFCELCVASRTVGVIQKKFCRQCGTELTPVKVQVQKPNQKSFYSELPGTFVYPAKGSGLFVIIVCTIVIFALGFISRGMLSIFSKMVFLGYLFSFMQNILHSTSSGDAEIPGFPSFDDLFGCFLRLFGAVALAFGPALTLFFIAFFGDESTAGSTFMIPALIFGCLYFPMALLAVAMKDTPLAANPLVVIPSICKAPLEYLITVLILAAIMGLRGAGDPVISAVFPKGLATHSMPKLFGFLGSWAVWNFVEVYLLAVNMRILGTLYVTKKDRLGWFSH